MYNTSVKKKQIKVLLWGGGGLQAGVTLGRPGETATGEAAWRDPPAPANHLCGPHLHNPLTNQTKPHETLQSQFEHVGNFYSVNTADSPSSGPAFSLFVFLCPNAFAR